LETKVQLDHAVWSKKTFIADKTTNCPDVKEMHFAACVVQASHTPSASFREVWRKCITVLSKQQQDIADYVYHVRQQEEEASSQKRVRSKQ